MKINHYFSLLLVVSGCMGLTQESFNRKAMLENIAYNIILPAHEACLNTTEPLEEAVKVLVESPDEMTLDAAQTAWRDAIIAWRQSNLFETISLLLVVLI